MCVSVLWDDDEDVMKMLLPSAPSASRPQPPWRWSPGCSPGRCGDKDKGFRRRSVLLRWRVFQRALRRKHMTQSRALAHSVAPVTAAHAHEAHVRRAARLKLRQVFGELAG